MSMLRTFLSEFWPTFVAAEVIFPLLFVGRAISLDKAVSFVSPRDFAELAPFSIEDQKRLLRDAQRKAFPLWRLSIQASMYATVLAASLASGRMLAITGIMRDSFWMSTGISVLLVGFGWWELKLAEVRRIRKCLKDHISRGASDMRGPNEG